MTDVVSENARPDDAVEEAANNDMNATINSYGPAAPKTTSLVSSFGLVFFLAAIIVGFSMMFLVNPLVGCLIIGGGTIVGLIIVVWGEKRALKKEKLSKEAGAGRTENSELASIRQQLSRYQDITRSQATKSFWVGQVACMAGLAIIAGGCYVIVGQAESASTQIAVAALSALGAVLTSFIGSTFFRMYRQAQTQMNFYYAQPLVHSYLLQAKELSDGFKNPDASDVATDKIINQTLEVAAVAAQLINDSSGGASRAQRRTYVRPATRRATPNSTGARPAADLTEESPL